MPVRFVVIDDDVSVRKIIRNIIEHNGLGTVVAECADGLAAEKVIGDARPDIAVIDLLLPGQDGVELVKKLRATAPGVSLIMVSQSSSQPMITQAYQHGIEFYIHKPINVLELITVINKVKESRDMKDAMSVISRTTAQYVSPGAVARPDVHRHKSVVYKVFSDLGILGEGGARSIFQMTRLLAEEDLLSAEASYQLADIYVRLAQEAGQDTKTIEQRVRRAIAKALQNLANIGVDDYHNDRFQTYSTALFDFSEVRQEMNFIQGKSPYHGKINVRKFIEGLAFLASEERV